MLASITQSGANGISGLPNGETSWFRPSPISGASLFLPVTEVIQYHVSRRALFTDDWRRDDSG